MARLPAVPGLLKHQLYMNDVFIGARERVVQTFWTWRNDAPIPQARCDHENAQIRAWAQSSAWRLRTRTGVAAQRIKTWDFSVSPPTRRVNTLIFPEVVGEGPSGWPPQTTAVIALRTQPIGSVTRNRLNGRTHHPYPELGGASAGQWTSVGRANFVALYNNLLVTIDPTAHANSGDWVVPCWFEAGVLRVGGPLLPPVDHILCRALPGVNRRRAYHPGPYARGA